jgi:hypothetical protein
MEIRVEAPHKTKKVELPFDPTTTHLDMYPEELNSSYNRDICTLMLIGENIHNNQIVESA